MNKGTKGLSFPRNPSAELREMLLEQSKEPVDARENAAGDAPAPTSPATTAPPPPALDDSKLYSEQRSGVATMRDSNVGSEKGSYAGSTLPSKEARQRGSKAAKEQAGVDAILSDLQDQPLSQLNVRVPQGINDWLDEEAHRQRKKGVTKQSLVTRAITMLMAQQAEEKGSE